MDELRLIDTYFAGRSRPREDVLLGIGDDGAVTRLPKNVELVIAADMLCEGSHFPPATSAHALGHRCLAVNLSDLAAMSAKPLWCTLALSLPAAEPDWLQEFADGFFALAEQFDVALIGGDTVRGPLTMTVNVHGQVNRGGAVRRSGARPGDGIYVTGRPGLAATGLQILQSVDPQADQDDAAVKSFLYPQPRVAESLVIAGLVSAMIDLSDGLAVDVERMLTASQCGAQLEIADLVQNLSVEQVLFGGDDYELCFCVPAEHQAELLAASASWACPVTRIGTVLEKPGIVWRCNGQTCDTVGRSFEHFA